MERDNLNISRIALIMLKKMWIPVLFAVVGFLLVNPFINRGIMYSARATVYAVVKSSYSDAESGRDALQDYADIILSQKVLNRAIPELQSYRITAEMLPFYVTPEYVKGSALLTIRAVTPNPQMSIDIANAVQDAFLTELNSITGMDFVKVLDYANQGSVFATSARSNLDIFAAIVFGFIAFSIMLVAEIFSNKIKTPEDIYLAGKVNIIGTIPLHKV